MNATVSTATTPVVIFTAFVGLVLATAHFLPLVWFTLPIFIATVVVRRLTHHPILWAVIAAAWAVAVVVRRQDMEDHVYVYLAWVVALAVALAEPDEFVDLISLQARRILAVVFAFATFWKLVSGEFISGAALWTFGLFDDRLGPLMRAVGVSAESYEVARPDVETVAIGQAASFEIELSSYSSLALLAVSIGTLIIEGLIAVSHGVSDTNQLARLRIPALLVFGLLTYAVVPVLPFALILAMIGAAAARFSRAAVISMLIMVIVVTVRFFTL